MPRLLAIETATELCSAALFSKNRLVSRSSRQQRAHAEVLLPMIDDLLQTQRANVGDLEFIAFGCGPGSFTGLRIGFGVAQGLAFAAQLPMVGVDSLLNLATQGAQKYPQALLVSALDARMDEIYWAAYSVEGGKISSVQAPSLDSSASFEVRLQQLSELASAVRPLVILGPGAGLKRWSIASSVICESTLLPNAETVAEISQDYWHKGQSTPADRATLLYLRNSVSWNKRTRIRQAPS